MIIDRIIKIKSISYILLVAFIATVLYTYIMDKTYKTIDITDAVQKASNELAKNQEIVRFMSKNPFNIYDIFNEYDNISNQEVFGILTIPENSGNKKLPLIIGVAGSGNWREHHYEYLDRYNQDGYATLALQSFDSRNVESTVGEQISCTIAMMSLDSYSALQKLSYDNRIDPERIAITGWSLGGGVALFTAWKPIKDAISPDHSFAAHLPIYPPCISEPDRMEFTDAPVHILIGELDDWVPADACVDFVQKMVKNGADARITVFPDSHHSFDSNAPVRVAKNAYSVKDCRLTVDDDGIVYTKDGGFPMSSPILQKIGLFLCAERGTHWGENKVTKIMAAQEASRFMFESLSK